MTNSDALRLRSISVDEYLEGEAISAIKHEYVGGRVYGMVGGKYAHNLIASNVLIELGAQLRGRPCRALNSDSHVKIQTGSQPRFYYPDVSVICGDHIRDGLFQDCPSVIVEVMSQGTRRIDEGEKRDAYLSLPTLSTYILLEQSFVGAIVYQRDGDHFERSVSFDVSESIPLPLIDCHLPLASVYAEVSFSSDVVAEE